MTISYKGVEIKRGWLGLTYRVGPMKRGPFEHYSEVEKDIDRHIVEMREEFDEASIYKEDRR